MAEYDALFLSFQEALVGRYSLERELGRGGMGVVYLAREVELDRAVAIKLLPPALARDNRLRDQFKSEARIAARLSHPNVVPIFRVDEIGGFVFYVMAYVDGETLSQRVAARGAITPRDVTRIMRDVAQALAYAHSHGIVHRDIKPANILLERGTERAMVTDFGIARLTHASGESPGGELRGTPEYMSPEHARGDQLDGRSDLYSLGLVAFYALTGSLPHTATSTRALAGQHPANTLPSLSAPDRGTPHSLAQVIARCLHQDAGARFPSGEALAAALAPSRADRLDVPVAVRVFLDRRRMVAAIAPLAILVPTSIGLWVEGAYFGVDPDTVPALVIMATTASVAAAGIMLYRTRKLVRMGYGPDDIVAALRSSFTRRHEEFQFEHGALPSVRERVLRVVGTTGLGFGSLALAAMGIGLVHSNLDLISASVASLYVGTLASGLSAQWTRIRKGKPSVWMAFWQGKAGRLLARLASFKIGERAAPADRPTELAIAMSGEAIYASLSNELRESLGDVPAVLRQLEARARAVRAQIDTLDATLSDARDHSARSEPADRQLTLVEELEQTRAAAGRRLAEVVSALENLRLDLLRLRAGAGTAESATRDLAAARDLDDEMNRMIEGQREVDEVLNIDYETSEEPTPV